VNEDLRKPEAKRLARGVDDLPIEGSVNIF
jgi:hypothetical protein